MVELKDMNSTGVYASFQRKLARLVRFMDTLAIKLLKTRHTITFVHIRRFFQGYVLHADCFYII